MRKPRNSDNIHLHPLRSASIGLTGVAPDVEPHLPRIHPVRYRCFSFDRPSGGLGSKHKPFHGQREAIFFVGTGHKPGLMLHV